MIDVEKEQLVSLREACRLFPSPRGRVMHENTVRRWISIGVRGIKLEAIKLGAAIVTSREAIARWLDRINNPQSPVESAPVTRAAVAAHREAASVFVAR